MRHILMRFNGGGWWNLSSVFVFIDFYIGCINGSIFTVFDYVQIDDTELTDGRYLFWKRYARNLVLLVWDAFGFICCQTLVICFISK